MNVWLIDFDSIMENLALMKLSAWHKTARLIKVSERRKLVNYAQALPPLFDTPDKVYISCIFKRL